MSVVQLLNTVPTTRTASITRTYTASPLPRCAARHRLQVTSAAGAVLWACTAADTPRALEYAYSLLAVAVHKLQANGWEVE
jgi:hypothetical protein